MSYMRLLITIIMCHLCNIWLWNQLVWNHWVHFYQIISYLAIDISLDIYLQLSFKYLALEFRSVNMIVTFASHLEYLCDIYVSCHE